MRGYEKFNLQILSARQTDNSLALLTPVAPHGGRNREEPGVRHIFSEVNLSCNKNVWAEYGIC